MVMKAANSRCKEIMNTLYSKSIILKVEILKKKNQRGEKTLI